MSEIEQIKMSNGATVVPTATFMYGKEKSYPAAVVIDDGCYVLCIPDIVDGEATVYRWSTHIFPEAHEVIAGLPKPERKLAAR